MAVDPFCTWRTSWLKAQKRGVPPVFSSSRHKTTSNMAATSSNSLGQVNTLSEKIKRYKTGEFTINPCDVLIEPLVRPLKEFVWSNPTG